MKNRKGPSGAEEGPRRSNPHERAPSTSAAISHPKVAKQLRQLAVDEDTSHQKLLGEALDLLFQSRRLPTIASK